MSREENRSVAAVESCYCFITVAVVIVLWLGALFLLFVLLYCQRVASHSSETLRELPRDTKKITDHKREDVSYIYTSEIPTEFARENISSLHVKITCSVYT